MTLFYFHGKTFNNEEDLIKHISDWNSAKITDETFEEILYIYKEGVKMNLKIYWPETTNNELSEIFNDIFFLTIKEFHKNLAYAQKNESK